PSASHHIHLHTHSIQLLFTFFFFHYPAPTEIYTLSLHDALPISAWPTNGRPCLSSWNPGASPTKSRSACGLPAPNTTCVRPCARDRKSTRLNSSHLGISYAVFCLKKKKRKKSKIKQNTNKNRER